MAEQAALRQAVEHQAGEVADLREERGRLGAEPDAARAADLFSRRNTRRLTLALATLAAVLLVAGTLAAAGWMR